MPLQDSNDYRQDLVFFGDGCCRFDDWKANGHGYLTIDQCLEVCNNDLSCVAADVARKRWDGKYDCYTFEGSLDNLHAACGNKKDEHCYARKKPTSKNKGVAVAKGKVTEKEKKEYEKNTFCWGKNG